MVDLLCDKINNLNPYGDINFDDSHIEFNAHPSSTVDLFQLLPLSSPVPLPSISLEQVTYTFDTTSELVVGTRSYGSQTIIPNVLSLQNIALSISIGLRDVSTLIVIFTGDFVVGGTTIPVEGVYTHASREISINAEVSELTINFQSIATQLIGLNLPSPLCQSISIPSFVISGKVTSGESELIVSATGGNTHVYIIYKKTDKSRKAIAFEMSNIELASVLNDIVGLDISGIPYFETTVLPKIALIYATSNIYGLSKNIFANSPLLDTFGNRVGRDLRARIMFTFSDNSTRLCYVPSDGGNPTFIPGNLNVQTLIFAIPGFGLDEFPLPPGVSSVLSLGIDEFSLNLKRKAVRIVVSHQRSLTFFDGLLSVDSTKLIMRGPTGGIRMNVEGDFSIDAAGKLTLHVSLL